MNCVIHAIWLGKNMSPLSLTCIDDWLKQGYSVKLWTDADEEILSWIDSCYFAKECYKRGLFAFVTDYLRLKILHTYGGLYLDTDVTIRKNPFTLFENVNFSVGFESEKHLGTAIIYANNKSDILQKIINFYENEIMTSPLYMGPEIMTHFINRKVNNNPNEIALYPTEYFYSYKGDGKVFATHDNSYLVHWFQHSWKDPKEVF
ncbi:glycosyltransferase family 32 protein [Vibrio taketomensis]|uniref:glycosyltransferase family 32 protein n=1 Tax=Vibrio taketomensis TaxID=2572923 RepID=UPI001E658F3A|nr:TcdA/TcdB catalytic glycosyltransferase domain-containing protein [Vibrio taketomensis]